MPAAPGRHRRHRHRALVLLLVAAVAASACAREARDLAVDATTTTEAPGTGGGAQPPDAGADEYDPGPLEWEDCGNAECTRLDVPLDYAEPDGPTIGLLAARVPARGEREGALFFNPGGPGAAAAELTWAVSTLLPTELRARFDIVGIDPRGIGESTPLDCGPDPRDLYAVDPGATPADARAALLEGSRELAAECQERAGHLLAHLGSRAVARDMDAVRAGMGDEQLSYLGFSYGTVIGQVYAELFPHRVRAMVLDGLVELGPTGIEHAAVQARGFDQALQQWARRCAGDPSCPAGPDPLALLDRVQELADQGAGIPAPGADRPAGPGEATLGVVYAMYAAELWPQLDQALADAAAGDASRLVRLADSYLELADFSAYYAVTCLDFAWPDDPDEVFAAADAAPGRFGADIVLDGVRCTQWPVPPDPIEPVEAPGTPPIVVISTTGDPATPYESGVAVAERLENGALVTYRSDGHTAVLDGDPCLAALVTRYLVDLVPPEDGATCP